MQNVGTRRIPWLAAAAALLLCGAVAQAQQRVLHDSFETKIGFVRSGADAPFEELGHTLSEDAHDSHRSEFLHVKADKGSFIHYQYPVGQAPLTDEFSASIWIKSDRPGIKLYARVILPEERDAKFLENRLSVLLPGQEYRAAGVGRWQPLEIPHPMKLLKKAVEKLQSKEQLGREVKWKGAYVDSLVLDVFAGPGQTKIWIDSLDVGPVMGPAPSAQPPQAAGVAAAPVRAENVVKVDGTQLLVGDRKFFMRGIRQTDTPLRVLRDAGFNTVFVPAGCDPKLLREASDLGLWLVPRLSAAPADPRFVSTDGLAQEVNRIADNPALLAWNMGERLNRQQVSSVSRSMQAIQALNAGRCFIADVDDGIPQYSHFTNLMVGVHRWPLMSTLEMLGYRDWLDQRRKVAPPGAYLWTWIQTHMSDEATQLIYERTGHDAFREPVGPQPEQIRLMTYIALAAGCKGINFWSDRWLANSHQGRDRLLCCAMLNQELDLLEPLVGDETPLWIDTSLPDVKAAVLRTAKGALVLPIWLGKGSQYVPGQAAAGKVVMVVPQIPQTMQAWEVHPADVRSLRCERVVGGTKVTLSEFSMTSAILFTADLKLVHRLKERSENSRQLAAQWSYDLAVYELEKVRLVHDQLVAQGQNPTESAHLLAEAHKRLLAAREMWDTHSFSESYHESQRAMRPMRILMRMHWDRAVKGLDTPVASPYATSYFSLPRHWQFVAQKEGLTLATNALPGGEFETVIERSQEAWHSEEIVHDDVEVSANRVSDVIAVDVKGKKKLEAPHGGKQCALLQIKAAPRRPAPSVLENTRIAVVSPTVKLQPGSLAQVTAWIYLAEAVSGSPDGAMFYDSVGGEEFGVRLTEPTKKWKRFTLYRRVPASGSIHVTLALTGMGSVYFDDVSIEPLVAIKQNVGPGAVRLGEPR